MNTYYKFATNVFVAKCTEQHEKGEIIPVTTKYGKENDSIVFNLVYQKDGFFYYSIIRADGMNVQEWAKKRAEKLQTAALNAEKKSNDYYERSHELTDMIPMGQPILVGHYSEKAHRNALDKSWSAMGKSVEMSDKAENYESRAEYWAKKAKTINLSMPESIDFYQFKLEEAIKKHQFLKDNPEKRSHSFSLTYAKKEVNEMETNLKLARRLWE